MAHGASTPAGKKDACPNIIGTFPHHHIQRRAPGRGCEAEDKQIRL